MARNQTYRAFVARPTHVLDLNGELLDSAPIMSQLASEIQGISSYATYVTRNDKVLGERLALVGAVQPATAGRRAGVIAISLRVPPLVSMGTRAFRNTSRASWVGAPLMVGIDI